MEDRGQWTPCRIWTGSTNFKVGNGTKSFRQAAVILAGLIVEPRCLLTAGCKQNRCCALDHMLANGKRLPAPPTAQSAVSGNEGVKLLVGELAELAAQIVDHVLDCSCKICKQFICTGHKLRKMKQGIINSNSETIGRREDFAD
jgi:hypothetical protein